MSTIKRAALDALASALQAFTGSVPVKAVQADYEKDMVHPSIQLMPRKFTFNSFNDEELDSSVSDHLLVNVGCFEGQMEIRVGALSRSEREAIQELVWGAFCQDELRSGIIVAQTPAVLVMGTQYLAQATVVAQFPDDDGSEEWREEMVFTAERYSYLTVGVSYPALVSRVAYDINELSVAFTEDLTSDDPAIDEEREINQDGTATNI